MPPKSSRRISHKTPQRITYKKKFHRTMNTTLTREFTVYVTGSLIGLPKNDTQLNDHWENSKDISDGTPH